MLHLSSGERLDGDDELVYREVVLEQAGGDGMYAADVAEALDLPVDRVTAVLADLAAREVLAAQAPDDQLGPRYTTGRAG